VSYMTEIVVHTAQFVARDCKLTETLPFDKRGQSLVEVDTKRTGGTKVFCDAFLAANFNYLDSKAFEQWLIDKAPFWAVVSINSEMSRTTLVFHDSKLVCRTYVYEGPYGDELTVEDLSGEAKK
jgi:hypothetical protein